MSAAKRKGSFKKWLRSTHRKFTSNSSNIRNVVGLKAENTTTVCPTSNGTSKYLNLTTNSDLECLKNKVSHLNFIVIEKKKII